MEILKDGKPVKVRLAHIDCPEKRGRQPFGNAAKAALSNLCFNQQVTVFPQNYDRYRRLIAVVRNARGQIVNQEMVRMGMAWHFKKYSSDELYTRLEIKARDSRIGLWQDAHPVAPWQWRKQKYKRTG